MSEKDSARLNEDQGSPKTEAQEVEVKVPVETEDSDTTDLPSTQAPEMDEEAMVAEAIRRGEQAAEVDAAADADKVRAERDELAAKLSEAEDAAEKAKADAEDAAARLGRLQADWENFRRRTDTERIRERELATEKLVTNLLPVIDDMERAIAHATSANDADENLQQFADGVSQVRTKMLAVLEHEGVTPIEPAGEPFDPMCHQAVGRVEDAEAFDETVRDVYQLGYKMANKIIRPAMVTVTFGGPKRPAQDADAEPSDGDTDTE